MKIKTRQSWQVSPEEAVRIQKELAAQVSRRNEVAQPRFIAGVDISVPKVGEATGAVIVLGYPGLEPVEVKIARGEMSFPYIPGLLSFREAPLALAAFAELEVTPDLVIVDGQGIAHPRRLGIAAHLGLILDIPTIGCAKSPLWGSYREPASEAGSYAEITAQGEVIGAALRTKTGVKPVFVSIGHKIDLAAAIYWVLACGRGYRLPEPTRLAHLTAGGHLKAGQKETRPTLRVKE